MTFRATYKLRFAHCDPAGIAYYPRLLELVDAAIEDWTPAALGLDRRQMHLELGLGLPTVELRTRFVAPCRLGELLDFDVSVLRVGTSSVDLAVAVSCGGEARFAADLTQVLIAIDRTASLPWPAPMRARLIAARPERESA